MFDLGLVPFGRCELAEPAVKRCTACRNALPLDSFRRSASGRLGRITRCRTCMVAADRRINSNPVRVARERARTSTPDAVARRRAYERKRLQDPRRKDWLNHKNRARRALRKGSAAEKFSRVDLFDYWDSQGWHACHWCELEFADDDPMHVDHLVPLSRGGAHELSNLVPAHRSCNCSKGAKDPYEFAVAVITSNEHLRTA